MVSGGSLVRRINTMKSKTLDRGEPLVMEGDTGQL